MESGDINELQKAADCYGLKNTTKAASTPNIIWGIINIILGLWFMMDNSINVILVILGVFMLAIGIWARTSQQAKALLFDAISFFVLAAWNIVTTAINIIITINAMNSGSETTAFTAFGVVAVWQIFFGIAAYSKYSRYSELAPQKPSKEMLSKIDQLTKSVFTTKPNLDKDIILFNRQDGWGNSVWGAKLGENGNYSIFTSAKRDNILFLKPSEIVIHQTGNFRGMLKANFILKGYAFKGTIHSSFLQRFETWEKAMRNI